LQLNIFESEWQYFNPFRNAALLNEPIDQIFAMKLVAMATSLKESEKNGPDQSSSTNAHHLVKKS